MSWGQPGSRAQLAGRREAGDIADLGHQDRRGDGADPMDHLNRPISTMRRQAGAQVGLHDLHLVFDHLQQVTAGVDPIAVGAIEGLQLLPIAFS
jgi:hypothetical protein